MIKINFIPERAADGPHVFPVRTVAGIHDTVCNLEDETRLEPATCASTIKKLSVMSPIWRVYI